MSKSTSVPQQLSETPQFTGSHLQELLEPKLPFYQESYKENLRERMNERGLNHMESLLEFPREITAELHDFY